MKHLITLFFLSLSISLFSQGSLSTPSAGFFVVSKCHYDSTNTVTEFYEIYVTKATTEPSKIGSYLPDGSTYNVPGTGTISINCNNVTYELISKCVQTSDGSQESYLQLIRYNPNGTFTNIEKYTSDGESVYTVPLEIQDLTYTVQDGSNLSISNDTITYDRSVTASSPNVYVSKVRTGLLSSYNVDITKGYTFKMNAPNPQANILVCLSDAPITGQTFASINSASSLLLEFGSPAPTLAGFYCYVDGSNVGSTQTYDNGDALELTVEENSIVLKLDGTVRYTTTTGPGFGDKYLTIISRDDAASNQPASSEITGFQFLQEAKTYTGSCPGTSSGGSTTESLTWETTRLNAGSPSLSVTESYKGFSFAFLNNTGTVTLNTREYSPGEEFSLLGGANTLYTTDLSFTVADGAEIEIIVIK